MKTLFTVILSALVFGTVVAISGTEVAPLWGKTAWSFLISAALTTLLMTVFGYVGMLVLGGIGGLFGALAGGKDGASVGACLGIVLMVPIVFIAKFYLIRFLGSEFTWYPALSTGMIWLYIIGTTLLSVSFNNKESKS